MSGENKLRNTLLDENKFAVTWEIVPGRGSQEEAQDFIFQAAEEAAAGGIVDAITITDNPGGNPAMSAQFLGIELKKMGIEPVVHLTCKDRNRNDIEAQLHCLNRAGVRNLMVMSGDYPVDGYAGPAKPVFDLDPAQALGLINSMNAGLEIPTIRGTKTLPPTDFFAGVAVSPFKCLESEQMCQYYKLHKKIMAGAGFVITQVGYDARKFHELLTYMRLQGWSQPLLGNLYVLTYGSARAMNANRVPGCVVTDELLSILAREREAPDKGKAARLERAAKMYAFMKGMGYSGVHIGGMNLSHDDVQHIVERGEELTPNWKDIVTEFDFPQPDGFYYFQRDDRTGLNTDTPAPHPARFRRQAGYIVFRVLHRLLFEPDSPLFGVMRFISRLVDGSPLEKPFTFLEHITKVATNGCMRCGDCALFDIAYMCPMSQCPKNQRNGPCGGSYMGWCEVYPNERKCIYVRAYERLKPFGKEETLKEYIIAPRDWKLNQTSSWLNYYLGRDHSAERLGIKPPAGKNQLGTGKTAS